MLIQSALNEHGSMTKKTNKYEKIGFIHEKTSKINLARPLVFNRRSAGKAKIWDRILA